MRTTLTIDDDVLSAAKERARLERKTVGEVIPALVRQVVQSPVSFSRTRSAIPLLPIRPDAKPVTLRLVNRLRDELP
jgi:hypothetical protein